MIYRQLTRFLLPLALTVIVFELSLQVLSGGMARVPRATETLASFGLAWGLVMFMTSAVIQARQLGLVLVDSRGSYRRVQRFVFGFGLLLAAILAFLSLSSAGGWIIRDLHSLNQSLAAAVRQTLLWLIPIPLFFGITRFYTGLLIRIKRTDMVSYAMMANICVSILAVFILLPTSIVQENPIWLPILVIYSGVLLELSIVLGGYWRYVRPTLLPAAQDSLSYGDIFRFFWPLALIMGIQGLSRPLINLFVSREAGGAEALAVLTVVYVLGHIPYGWLNENRSLATAFQDQSNSLYYIRHFITICGLISFAIMVVLFWTPIQTFILEDLIGLEPALAALAVVPLLIFSFFPLPVSIRSYLHGIGLLEHRTKAMAPSAPSRIGAILVALIILPFFGVFGATRGVAALFCGFMAEATVVWWGVRGRYYDYPAVTNMLLQKLRGERAKVFRNKL